MPRFEVHYSPEEDDRQSSWDVVEWTTDYGNGCRSGRTVQKFEYSEEAAHELCRLLQEEYNREFYSEFG